MTIRGRPYVPVGHEDMIRCDFLHCLAGLGLAGAGGCFLMGIWWHPACPRFVDEKEWVKEREREAL